MEDCKNKEVIDLREVVKQLWNRKKLFLIVWFVTFVVSCLIILPVPRTYHASVSMAPEATNTTGGTLSSIASSFGFNMGNMTTEDAFYPDIYPEVVASNNFVADLMTINVKSLDGTIATDYQTYMDKYQKKTFYMIPILWIKKQLKELFGESSVVTTTMSESYGKSSGPLMLTEKQMALYEDVKSAITCSVDKKNGIITINVIDQDPLICATMADSTRLYLQNFITQYRTGKARVDYEYYLSLTNEAKRDYEDALQVYGAYCDSHLNTILQSELSKRDELENDLSLKLNAYNTMNTQLLAAKAKIQETTPAFALLESPTVPVKPSGPKRVIFVLAMMFLAFVGTVAYIFKKEILQNLYRVN